MELRGGRSHAEEWINGVFNDENKTQVSQCLNDIENMQAWTGGNDLRISNGQTIRVYHKSAGKIGTSQTCTLFFIPEIGNQRIANVIGVYKHKTSTTYEKKWSQTEGGRDILPNTISLS